MFAQTKTTYALLRQAIIDRSQVICTYNGLIRECCPHSIGLKGSVEHVLMFQFAGQSRRGLPPGGCWRCLDIGDLSFISTRPGQWFTRDDHRQRQSCIDRVDLDVTMC